MTDTPMIRPRTAAIKALTTANEFHDAADAILREIDALSVAINREGIGGEETEAGTLSSKMLAAFHGIYAARAMLAAMIDGSEPA